LRNYKALRRLLSRETEQQKIKMGKMKEKTQIKTVLETFLLPL